METCVRGFSYMPETKVEEVSLQFIENEELEKTWKTSRRQRLKQQEQKIWDEFVKEQDILSSVCEDDPYQFLEQLPESCLKELMEIELQRMQKEREDEQKPQEPETPESPVPQEPTQTVTFADEIPEENHGFHLFDEDNDNDDGDDMPSGPEDEAIVESPSSPSTVRDAGPRDLDSPTMREPHQTNSKSSENITSMIENSIYCAKVKELRSRINEEMVAIVEALELRDIQRIEPEDLVKMCRRAAEFSGRFNRIHMYQLHRQIHDINRNNNQSLPFARHTQFQAQLVRATSLHQNLLQSLQVFNKSLEQTGCVRECVEVVRGIVRAVAAICSAAPQGAQYCDDMISTSERLLEAAEIYNQRMEIYMATFEKTSRLKKSNKARTKKKPHPTWSKASSKPKSDADSRLSMYSLDTLRLVPRAASTHTQESGGTSKIRVNVSSHKTETATTDTQTPKGNKKSPRSRRPLMRAPPPTKLRIRRQRDSEVTTMVETMGPCTSSHMSREPSPLPRSRNVTPRELINRIPYQEFSTTPKSSPTIKKPPPKPTSSPKKRGPPKPLKALLHSVADLSRVDSYDGPGQSNVICTAFEESPKSPPMSPIEVKQSPKIEKPVDAERDSTKVVNLTPERCEVSRIVRQLCGGDAAGGRSERVSGAKNAQLHCITGSPRAPTTPQLLRILEETIQKKVPKALYQATHHPNTEKLRLALGVSEGAAARMFQYRTQFVQHMLSSPLYANCTVGKPWEIVGSISENLIEELLLQCAKEMQLEELVDELYTSETS